MPKHVLRNTDVTEFDVAELERTGLVRPGGRLTLTQAALEAFEAATQEADRLAAMIRRMLLDGCDVEAGDLDAGLFVEQERKPNWRSEFVKVGGDPATVLAATPKTPTAPRLRVFEDGDLPKGERVAPTADGVPVVDVKSAGGDGEAKEAA